MTFSGSEVWDRCAILYRLNLNRASELLYYFYCLLAAYRKKGTETEISAVDSAA